MSRGILVMFGFCRLNKWMLLLPVFLFTFACSVNSTPLEVVTRDGKSLSVRSKGSEKFVVTGITYQQDQITKKWKLRFRDIDFIDKKYFQTDDSWREILEVILLYLDMEDKNGILDAAHFDIDYSKLFFDRVDKEFKMAVKNNDGVIGVKNSTVIKDMSTIIKSDSAVRELCKVLESHKYVCGEISLNPILIVSKYQGYKWADLEYIEEPVLSNINWFSIEVTSPKTKTGEL